MLPLMSKEGYSGLDTGFVGAEFLVVLFLQTGNTAGFLTAAVGRLWLIIWIVGLSLGESRRQFFICLVSIMFTDGFPC